MLCQGSLITCEVLLLKVISVRLTRLCCLIAECHRYNWPTASLVCLYQALECAHERVLLVGLALYGLPGSLIHSV